MYIFGNALDIGDESSVVDIFTPSADKSFSCARVAAVRQEDNNQYVL